MEPVASRAVFLSYASQDAEAARRIADALRSFGVEVWFDQSELRGGDAWDAKLRRQIKECALFIAIISKNTDARLEGYFRREWKLAIDRTHDLAEEKAFLLPVVIDDTPDGTTHVPEKFHEVQWTRLPRGATGEAFALRVKSLLYPEASGDGREAKGEAPMAGNFHPAKRDEGVASPIQSKNRAPVVMGGVVLVVLIATIAVMMSRKSDAPPAPAKPAAEAKMPKPSAPRLGEKSLVVLPLENLSPDPENAFFTDGMHAEIISTLSRLSGVTVISRDSSLALKRGTASLAEIAQKVGVANVVTGQVRRAGNSVRIGLELRRASDEALLWTKTYDKELRDVFAIQTDIAEELARVLQVRESKGTFAGAQFMTKDPRAYDLYLKCRVAGTAAQVSVEGRWQAFDECVKLGEEALKFDPGFMMAASYLSMIHVFAYGWDNDNNRYVRYAEDAKRWAEVASRILPGGAGDGALSFYYSTIERDNVRALALAENAIRAFPNEATYHNRASIALERLGRTNEAVAAVRRAIALDPLNDAIFQRGLTLLARARSPVECAALLNEYPGAGAPRADRRLSTYHRYVLFGELPKNLERIEARERFTWLWRERRFAEEVAAIDAELAAPTNPRISDWDRLYLQRDRCLALRRMGREEKAAEAGRAAITLMEKIQPQPDTDHTVKDVHRAWAFGCTDRGDEAIAAMRRAIEVLPASNRVYDRWTRESDLARIYAHFGRKRECIELLAKLLRVPSGLTVPMLRVDPYWDNVREDAGFKALLADPKNSAPL